MALKKTITPKINLLKKRRALLTPNKNRFGKNIFNRIVEKATELCYCIKEKTKS